MDLRTLAEAKSLRAAQQAGMRKGKSPREIALLEDQFAAVESDMVEYEGRPDFHMRTPVSYPSIFDGTLDLTQRISERFLGITVKDLSEESPYGIPYNKIDEALGMNKTQIEDKILATMEKQNVYGSRRKDVPGIRLNAAFTLYMMIAAHMKNHYQTFMMEGL